MLEFRKIHITSSKDPPGGPETRGNDSQGPRDPREKVWTPSGILWICCLGGFAPKCEFRPGRGFTTYDPTVGIPFYWPDGLVPQRFQCKILCTSLEALDGPGVSTAKSVARFLVVGGL